MKIIRHIAMAFLVVVAATAALATRVSAQQCPDGCIMCWNMLVGGTWYHNHNGNGDIYGCVDYFPESGSGFENRCLIVHQPCVGEDIPDLASLVQAVRLQEHQTLRNWLANAPHSLRINVPRHALQVIDCEGRVAYHLPMKEELLHTLVQPAES